MKLSALSFWMMEPCEAELREIALALQDEERRKNARSRWLGIATQLDRAYAIAERVADELAYIHRRLNQIERAIPQNACAGRK